MTKKIIVSLLIITLLGLFFHFYQIDKVPPCLNADEAAFSYNAYSLLKTGKDETGKFLPLRLRSFGDNKMPLISYLTVPFIALFGLNDWAIKLPNAFVLLFFPTVLYLFTNSLFKNKKIALLTSLLFVLSWSIQSMSRQLHEALLTAFLTTCSAYFFLLSREKKDTRSKFLFIIFNFLSLFSYQSSRLFALFFLCIMFYDLARKKISWRFFLIFLSTLIFFGFTDLIYKPQRVTNLLFINKIDFSNQINQLRGDGGSKIIYNKLTIGLKEAINEYLKYFSPQFLVITGDENYRFGHPGLSLITLIEYLFFFSGLYFLFKKKEKSRFYILGLLLISPLAGSLSWAGLSLTRSFFLLIPLLIVISFGAINFFQSFQGKKRFLSIIIATTLYFVLVFYNWDFYLNHYPKKALVIRAWQCGYQELSQYVKNNYAKFNHFYITQEAGPPYIFLLYYLKYPPEKFQPYYKLTQPDQYGFSQVEKFDKFIFNLKIEKNDKNFALIGRPLEVNDGINTKKIKSGTEEMFWINEVK